MKFWFGFLFILFLGSNLYWGYETYENNAIINVLLETMEGNSKRVSELRSFKEIRLHELLLNGRTIVGDCELTGANGDKCYLDDIIHGNKLILRYSNLNCHTCIEEQIKILNTYVDSIGVENILLFTTYDNYMYMNRFKEVNKIRFAIYNLTNEASKIFEDIGLPYYFVLTEGGDRINSACVPLKEAPDVTNEYMQLVCRRYFYSNARL